MRNLKRIPVLLLIAGAVVMPGLQAVAAQIKVATLAPENSAWVANFRKASAEIKERTEGRVQLKLYTGGAQGNEAKVLRKMKIGQLHGGTFSPTDFQKTYPDLNIYGLPFVFDSLDEVEYVRERIDPKLEQGIEELGYVTFGFASGGFAIILSNEPVRALADLQGKKVWLPEGDLISYEAMKTLQLSPVALPITDVLTGLQTGLIDIVTIPPVVALALQWHTKVKYVTQMPVLFAMGFMAIDKRAFGKLDAADQEIVNEVMTRIYADMDALSADDSTNATDALFKIGLEDVQPDDGEFSRIQVIMRENNREMAERGLFSMELLEEMQLHIDEFRNGNGPADSGVSTDDAGKTAESSGAP